VDGNHDNAFVIEPPFSGLVKTNIVLDREIRDAYRLTVIATDEGVPQLTGTSTLCINIVDVNDNQPTFPPHSVISVSEGEYMRHFQCLEDVLLCHCFQSTVHQSVLPITSFVSSVLILPVVGN
jgi:hypothetical protein